MTKKYSDEFWISGIDEEDVIEVSTINLLSKVEEKNCQILLGWMREEPGDLGIEFMEGLLYEKKMPIPFALEVGLLLVEEFSMMKIQHKEHARLFFTGITVIKKLFDRILNQQYRYSSSLTG